MFEVDDGSSLKKREKERDVRLVFEIQAGNGRGRGDFYSVLVSRSQRMFLRAQS